MNKTEERLRGDALTTSGSKVVIKDFWAPVPNFPNPDLMSNEVGWTISHKVESGGYTETWDVWEHLISHDGKGGFDLAFFYLGNMKMYLLDNIDHVIYEIPRNNQWDGKYLIHKFSYTNFDKMKAEEVFEFEKTSQVWDHFTIDGQNMQYILEHSVLILCH